jgi:hypothetical protein
MSDDFALRRVRLETQRRIAFARELDAELTRTVTGSPAPEPRAMDDLFGPVISTYTRRQAIEDGILVQLSGEGYEGDGWIPDMVAEAGFRFPLAMTIASFSDCVLLSPAAAAAGQDLQGRLWDVLWMLKHAINRSRSNEVISFTLHCSKKRAQPEPVTLQAVCGPGDDGAPVITIMYPHED